MVQTKIPENVSQSEESSFREMGGVLGRIVSVIAVAFALFHIYAGGVRPLVAYEQRGVHLTFALVLTFLLAPYKKGKGISWIDIALSVVSAAAGSYLFFQADEIIDRMGIQTTLDLVAGGVIALLVLEATRRLLGPAISIIAGVFLLYAYFGYLAPHAFAHEGYSIERIIGQLSLATEGIYGVPLGASATFVILFIIFASFLSESGAG